MSFTAILKLKDIKESRPKVVLGKGNFGEVTLARHRLLGLLAIKWQKLNGSIVSLHRHSKSKLEEEAQMQVMSSQISDHIVRCHGLCFIHSPHEKMGIVMEHMPGGTLHRLLFAPDRRLPLLLRLRAALEISRGMSRLHELGEDERVVHGDLKPLNVLLTEDLHCKISDFGGSSLATCTGRTSEDSRLADAGKETTWEYVAPERLSRRVNKLRKPMDVYSLAVVLYNLLGRARPSQALVEDLDDPAQLKNKYKRLVKDGHRPPPLVTLDNDESAPDEVADVMRDVMTSAWSQEAQERPTMIGIRDRLEECYARQERSKVMAAVLAVVVEQEKERAAPEHVSELAWVSMNSSDERSEREDPQNRFVEISDLFNTRDTTLGRCLIIGGYSNQESSDATFKFDPKDKSFSPFKRLPQPKSLHCSCLFKNFLFNFGGCQGREGSRTVHRMSLEREEGEEVWEDSCTRDSFRKRAAACCLYNESIMMCGGMDGTRHSASAYLYDPQGDKWTRAGKMKSARSYHGLVNCGGRLFCFGGEDEKDRRLKSIETYDPREGSWKTEEATLLERLLKFASVSDGQNKIHIMGGYNSVYHNTTQCFDVRQMRSSRGEEMVLARKDFACCMIDDDIFVSGGQGSEGASNTIERYKASQNKWEIVKKFEESICQHTMVAI